MAVISLRVLCANCGGDELLSRLVEGTTACPWCGLSFDHDFALAGEVRPILLPVVVARDEPIPERFGPSQEVAG